MAGLGHVTSVISPYAPGQHAISRDGTIGFATVSFDQRANSLPTAAVDKVITVAESARSSTLDVQLGGQAIEQAQQASLGFATIVGIAAAILILLISFGSFSAAMGLPIATALVGLGAGLRGDQSREPRDRHAELCLGAGADDRAGRRRRLRALHRHALPRELPDGTAATCEQAVEAAINTSGRAVLFAGATVVIALLGMFALGVSLLNGAAVAAAIGVVFVLAASLTLLPALLSLSGERDRHRPTGRQAARAGDGNRPEFWLSWVQRIQRHPALIATVGDRR